MGEFDSTPEDPMTHDDDLTLFAAHGPTPLPTGGISGYVDNRGARIWYASYGVGPSVILLHGGGGNSRNFGFQIPALIAAGYNPIVIDSRGHGRSTMDSQPFSYTLMATDVRAVMDALRITTAAIIGWSDGAATGLVIAKETPTRVDRLFFFGVNVDPTGTKPFVYTDTIGRCLERHKKDYAELSPTPDAFDTMFEALQPMQRDQPNYSSADLASITVPVTVAQAEHDEFIKTEHAEYVARTIPGARYVSLPSASHFAPVQRPQVFNAAILEFLRG
jgi:pimeloyl-ACP methyl ester carboxylesterase